MGEAEALKKICPVLPLYQGAPSLCHGTNCMAWRWRDGEHEFRFFRESDGIPYGWEPWPAEENELSSWNRALTRWRRRVVERRGYCGLAIATAQDG